MGTVVGTAKLWIGFVLVTQLLQSHSQSWASSKVTPKVICNDDFMFIELNGPNVFEAYLKGLKHYPEPSCRPKSQGDSFHFHLSLNNIAKCGTSQILNQITGSLIFYNRIVIVDQEGKHADVLVKCKREGEPMIPPEFDGNRLNDTSVRRRRYALPQERVFVPLPAGFEEQSNPRYGPEQRGIAPEPILSMVVKQEGRVIGEELLVQPGAPLMMEVSHIERRIQPITTVDEDVYGIIVSKLDVTDRRDQEEVIIINGCSVDPYLFENFQTFDGDILTAKFRAFKFPDSNYVLFKATVNICLGKCEPSQCSNGQTGYGRRRRSLSQNDVGMDGRNNGHNLVYYLNALLRVDESPRKYFLDDGTLLYRHKRLHRLTDDDMILELKNNAIKPNRSLAIMLSTIVGLLMGLRR